MNPQTFIFFGPSGCGKGTQAKLLMEKLKEKDPDREVIYIETGKIFREISAGNTYTHKKIKEMMETGSLVPVFIPIWAWTSELMKNVMTCDEHMFFDGVSRRLVEANVLDSALKFYERKNLTVVSFEVSDEWAKKLMRGRGRLDDTEDEMNRRLAWYKENTVPAIEYFKNDPDYRFIKINGEQTIEEVHKEVMDKLQLGA